VLAAPSATVRCAGGGAGGTGIDEGGGDGGMALGSWDDGWVLAGGGTWIGGGAEEFPAGGGDGRGGW
jgi:hypothetical protein